LAAFLVVGAAAGVQATTGFGFSLLAVPLLAAATDPRTSVVGSSIVALLLASVTAFHDRSAVRWRTVGGTLLAAPAGMRGGPVAGRAGGVDPAAGPLAARHHRGGRPSLHGHAMARTAATRWPGNAGGGRRDVRRTYHVHRDEWSAARGGLPGHGVRAARVPR